MSGREKKKERFFPKLFLFKLENNRFLIICVNTAGDCEKLSSYVMDSAHQAAQMFQENCTIAIGKFVSRISELPASYQQAKQYIEKKVRFFKKMSIVTEEDIKAEYKSKNTPDALVKKS
ncbi:hypothetical protein GCM10020331_046700 [Ectobacillus funiculus]